MFTAFALHCKCVTVTIFAFIKKSKTMFCGNQHSATKELDVVLDTISYLEKSASQYLYKKQDFSQTFVNCGKETAILYA